MQQWLVRLQEGRGEHPIYGEDDDLMTGEGINIKTNVSE